MKKNLLVIFFLIPISFAFAQTPSVTIKNLELACLGQVQRIPVTINGIFSADNKFSVQIKEDNKPTVLATIPAILKGTDLEVLYQDSTWSVLPMLQMRVISSSPQTESQWKYFKIHSKGSVQLSAAISDTVNLGEELILKFTTRSSTEVNVALNDGSQLRITSYSPSEFVTYHSIGASFPEPFSIRSATNSCGVMRASGSVRPVVNATSLRTKSVDALNACENSEIRIAFTTLGPALIPGSKYRVRFRSSDVSPFTVVQTMEAPAELKDGWIVTRVPEHLKLQNKHNFNVIILADEHGIVGSPGNFVLSVHPRPSVRFFTPDVNIQIGAEARVGVIFEGVPPFSAELGDGSSIAASYSGEVYVYKSPDKTTVYSVESMLSGCGITELPVRQNMTVGVSQGLALVPESSPQILCAGTRTRVRVRVNGNISASTSYTVHAYYSVSKSFAFPATRNGDYLEFMIPELPAGTAPDKLYDALYYLYIRSQNPAMESEPSHPYVIQSRPQVIPYKDQYSLDEPGIVSLSYQFYGKSPFTIEDEAGNRTVVKGDWWAPEVYVDKTREFKIKSISNSCYKTENIPAVRLTLSDNAAPGLYLEPISARVCANDSLEVRILAPGKFSDDNVFQIQAYADCCNFITLKTVRSGGTYKIKIPASQNGYIYPLSIKVVSTNPFLTSKVYQFNVDTALKDFVVKPAGTEAQPALLPNNGEQTIQFSATGGGLLSAVYADGNVDKQVAFEDPYKMTIRVNPVPGHTTAYTLKSMTNSCGTQPVNLTTFVKVLPYEVKIADFDFTVNKFCAGNDIRVPFAIMNGVAGDATFGMEISRVDENTYRPIASGQGSSFINATIPADLAQGNYKIRVVSSDNVASNVASFQLAIPASAAISSSLPQPITVSAGARLELDLRFTGTSPWTAVFEDNTNITTTHNIDFKRTVYPAVGQIFRLKTIYNECGYGDVSGSVEVQVPVRLQFSADSYAACSSNNFKVNYELLGDANLVKEYIRFELIDPYSLQAILLDSTQNRMGTIELKMPVNLKRSMYQVRCTYSALNLSDEFSIFITRPVSATLSGSTVINSGQETDLVVHNDNTIPEAISYQLSDGKKGVFYGGSGNEFIRVKPDKTTTYTFTSISNSCGMGKATGSATVEVNPPSERTVHTTQFTPLTLGFCLGDSIRVFYEQNGSFTPGNVLTVQLSDSTGRTFRSIPTVGKASPLRAMLPLELVAGKPYRIRVTASDPGTASGAYRSPLYTGQKAAAKFASGFAGYKEGSDPVAVVLLSGTGPWQYDIGLGNGKQTIYSTSAADSVVLWQALPGQVYNLLNVYGPCGMGEILTPSSTLVSFITAEPGAVLPRVTVAPNPAREYLKISFESARPRNVTLFNDRGISVWQGKFQRQEEGLNIVHLVPGAYLLRIEESGKERVYRFVKH
jgi:hypothetical protein